MKLSDRSKKPDNSEQEQQANTQEFKCKCGHGISMHYSKRVIYQGNITVTYKNACALCPNCNYFEPK